MAEEKIGVEATEKDQSAKVTESYDATRQNAGEYYDYGPASVTAGEHFETTRKLAAEPPDTATSKAGEVVARSRHAATRQAGVISAGVEAGRGVYLEAGRLVDVTGKPMEGHMEWRGGALDHGITEGLVNLTISRGEFDQLSIKTREILTEAALAQERIAKDQEEISLLKTETREMLRRLRAA